MKKFNSIEEIITALKNSGSHFFDKDTMKFFRSKVYSEVIHGKYFITSEKFSYDSDRLFTVREITGTSGNRFVNTVSDFQQFKYKYQAIKFAKNLK